MTVPVTPGTLIGVSLGPGDPELITRAAWAQLQRRDAVWVYPARSTKTPSYAFDIAQRAGLTPHVADRLDLLMAPVSDRQALLRLHSLQFHRAMRRGDHAAAERSALRRALLGPEDHRPWLDVAAARERQGVFVGALQALDRARGLDGVEEARRSTTFERVRMRLN